MAHFKRLIELNPSDYQSQFEIAQMFDQIDMPMALMYYEQGYRNISLEIEKRHKFSAETHSEEKFYSDKANIIHPEILNNIGVLRLDQAQNLRHNNLNQSQVKQKQSLEAFKEALRNIDRLIKLERKKGDKTEENKKL